MVPTIERIMSAAHSEQDEELQPMTLRQLRDAIENAAADLVDDDVPVLVRVRGENGEAAIGMLDALTICDGGGAIVEATCIESSN